MEREGARVIVYDEEFAGVVADARERVDGLIEILSWTDAETDGLTTDGLIAEHRGNAGARTPRLRGASCC